MDVNAENPFYEAATNHMVAQINYLETLLERTLEDHELDNMYEFYTGLPKSIKDKFEEQFESLV